MRRSAELESQSFYEPEDRFSQPSTNRPVTAERVAKPGWLALVSKFADRLLIGSDNFYDAPGVSLRDLPCAADVLNFVPQLPAGAQTKIGTENPLRLHRSLNA
jgi:hypothetical protein